MISCVVHEVFSVDAPERSRIVESIQSALSRQTASPEGIAVFHPNSSTGGNILGRRVVVSSGIFNPELLTERYGPEVGKIWATSRIRDRIDAVIAHEVAESITGTHEGAEALAAETKLPVSDGARRILRAMAGRGR
jgi:hypothetical protein